LEKLIKSYQSVFTPAEFFSGQFGFSFPYFRNFRTYYRFYYWYC